MSDAEPREDALDARAGGRRPPWRRWLLIVLGTPVILAAVYLLDAFRIWNAVPVVSVDHFAEINAAARLVAPGERAWPGIRDAVSRLGDATPPPEDAEAVPPARRSRWIAQVMDDSAGFGLPPWREVRSTDLEDTVEPSVAFMDAFEVERRSLLEALERPFRGFELTLTRDRDPEARVFFGETAPAGPSASVLEDGLLFATVPHLQTYRTAARMLDWDARRAAIRGDGDRILADLAGMLALGEGVRRPALLVNQLVGQAIDVLAFDLVLDLLSQTPGALDDRQLRILETTLAALPAARFKASLDLERATFDDTIQRLYSDDGGGDGMLLLRHADRIGAAGGITGGTTAPPIATFLLGPVVGRFGLSRAQATGIYHETLDAWEAAGDAAPHEVDRRVFEMAAGRSVEALDTTGYFSIAALIPSISPVWNAGTSVGLHADLALMVCRLESMRRDGVPWLEGFERLVASDDAVRDPFTGEPVRFGILEGRPTVWSVGPDLEDDAAAPIQDGRPEPRDPRTLRPDATIRESGAFWGRPPVEDADRIDGDILMWRGDASTFEG